MLLNLLQRGLPHHFKQRVTGRDPFQGGIALEQFLVETNAAVFPPKPAKTGFQRIAALDKQPWYLANAVDMAFRTRGLGAQAHHRRSLHEEFFDGLRDQAAFTSFYRFAHNRREVQCLLANLPRPTR